MASPPVPLSEAHETSGFDCGVAALDGWLARRALENQNEGASRTYVVCDGRKIAGYYALAVGSITRSQATGTMRRNMPEPIPVMVLGRLAVDRSWQGKGLGADMLGDAVRRTHQAAQIAGIRGMVLEALSEDAVRFYERWGFVRSPELPMKLMARMKDLQRLMERR